MSIEHIKRTVDIGDQGAVSTAAKQDTGNTSLAAINADTTAAKDVLGVTTGAAVVTDADGTIQRYLRGIVKLLITSGTIILGAGTAAIGKLAANSGVDIGDVDVTSVVPGTAATNLGKAEDAAHTDQDVGVMALAIRDDTLNARSGAENDYEPLHTNADGALWVKDTNSASVKKQKMVFGATTTVINTAVDVAAGNFSVTTTEFDNTNDATVPYAPYAKAVASFPDWAAAPVLGTTVELWGVLKDVDSTSDDTDAPSGTSQGGARYFGAWVIAAADALQRRTITISLDGVEKCDFYFKNGTAQNMNNDGGTSAIVKITPFAIGYVV